MHRRRRTRRRRSSGLVRWVRYGPPRELLDLVALPVSRHPLKLGLGATLLVWWFWPWIRPPAPLGAGVPDVIAVPIEDHRRTSTALDIWRNRPGALLVMMAPGGGEQSFALVRNADLTPEQRLRVIVLNICGDTVTEMADLSNWLAALRQPGQLQLVTSPAHVDRMTAIGQVMLGGSGWRVEGVGSLSSEHKPESPLRLVRDQLRAQVWRATRLTGKNGFICPGRAMGLF